jgi:PAS domain S-box-containing protein
MVFNIEKSLTEKKHYKKVSFNNKEKLHQDYKEFKDKYYALFNNSTNGIAYHKLIYDTNGKPINYIITEVNPQFETILHLKKEDVLNKTVTETYNVTKPPYLDIYSEVAETQKSCSFETYFQPMNIYFEISVISPKKGEFMTVFDDISEKKKLTESEDKYKLITENANDLICILSKNYKYEYINEKTYLKALGYSKNDLIGKSALKLNHPDDFKSFISSFWGKKEIDNRTLELRVKHKNGKWVWLNINIQRFFNEKNEKKFLLVSREITFRKLAERKIRESEEKYRHLFEDSPFAIALMNFEGLILECNSYMEQLLGFNKKELTGKDFRLINLVPESSLPRMLNRFERFSKGDILTPKEFSFLRKMEP